MSSSRPRRRASWTPTTRASTTCSAPCARRSTGRDRDWRAQLRAGIRAYLAQLARTDHFARIYIDEIHAVGAAALAARADALRRFADRYHASFSQARAADPTLREPDPDALLVLCAGTEQLVAERLRAGGDVRELEDVFCTCAEAVLTHHQED